MPLVAPLQQRITELRAEKERLQAALLASDFDYLDNFFKSRESNAADLDEINHPELFDAHTGPDAHGQLRLLQSWTEARPNSYYAHYFLGEFWELVAGDIRTTKIAAEVGADRWLGAAWARDNVAVVLLHAVTLHVTPVGALYLLMRVFAYLSEPDWMKALFKRRHAKEFALESTDFDAATWRLAQAHFDRYGGTRLVPPSTLPALLQARESHQTTREYWLAQILRIRPNCLAALTTAVYYLSPRWRGSHEDMRAFIEGPQCAALSEAQRGDLWWVKEDDYLEEFPDHDENEEESDEIALHRAAYAQLLARPLLNETRIATLFAYGEFLSYCGDLYQAYACAVEACRLQVEIVWPQPANVDHFELQARDLIDGNVEDTQGVLAQVLQVAEQNEESTWFLLLAYAARHEGKWGMPCEPYPGQLDRVLVLIASSPTQHRSVTKVLELLWEANQAECCGWLAHELANRGVALAHCFLANVYRGHYSDGPKIEVNLPLAEQWQYSAVSAKITHASAGYLLAKNYLIPIDFEILDMQVFQRVKDLLQIAVANDVNGALLLLMQVLVNSGSNEEGVFAHQHLIPPLLASEDREVHLAACISLICLYGPGEGVICSPFLAYHWSAYAQTIDEDEEYEPFLSQVKKIYRGKIKKNGPRGWFNKFIVRDLIKDLWEEAVAKGEAYLPPNILAENEDLTPTLDDDLTLDAPQDNVDIETRLPTLRDHFPDKAISVENVHSLVHCGLIPEGDDRYVSWVGLFGFTVTKRDVNSEDGVQNDQVVLTTGAEYDHFLYIDAEQISIGFFPRKQSTKFSLKRLWRTLADGEGEWQLLSPHSDRKVVTACHQAWNALLDYVNKGIAQHENTYPLWQQVQAEITPERILKLIALPLFTERYNDRWDEDHSGYWSGSLWIGVGQLHTHEGETYTPMLKLAWYLDADREQIASYWMELLNTEGGDYLVEFSYKQNEDSDYQRLPVHAADHLARLLRFVNSAEHKVVIDNAHYLEARAEETKLDSDKKASRPLSNSPTAEMEPDEVL